MAQITRRRIREDILLHDIRTKRYDMILQSLAEGVEPIAYVKSSSYIDERFLNLEMLPIHFAVRDCAPIFIIRALVEAWPMSLKEKDANNCKPIDFLNQENYSITEYIELDMY